MLKRVLTNSSYQFNGNLDHSTKTIIINFYRSLSTSRFDGGIIPPKLAREYNIYTNAPAILKVHTVNFEDKSSLINNEEIKKILNFGELKTGEVTDLEKFSTGSILDTISYLAASKTPIEHVKQTSELLLEHIFTNTKRQKEMNPHQYSILLDYLVGIQLKLGGLNNVIPIEKIFNLYFNFKNYLIFNHQKPQTLLIKLSTHKENHDSLPSLIDWIIKRNIVLHTANSIYLIRHLFNYSKVGSVIKYQNYLKPSITSQALYKTNYEFVRGYSLLGKMDLAEDIISSMQTKGISIPFFFHLSLIHGYGSKGDIDNLSNLYIFLLNQKVLKVPEKLTNIVSSYCKKPDQVQKVLDIFTNLKIELKDQLHIMNSKIKLSLMNKDIISANFILEEIKRIGIEPNHFTFIPLLDYYTQANDFDKAWKVFTTSKKHFVDSHQAKPIYDRIVNLCCIHKKPDLAYTLVQDIVDNSKTLNVSSFSPLLEYYFKNQKLDRVIEIYNDLFEVKNVPFNSYLFNIYLKSLCRLGDMKLVLNEFYKALKEEKIFVEIEFIRLIAQGLGMNTNVYRILEFFNDPIILEKHPIDDECYNSALFGLLYGRHWEEAAKFLDLEEFNHNARTVELVCGFGTRHERYGEVAQWYTKLIENNTKKRIVPTPLTLQNVIISYFHLSNHFEVERLFDIYSKDPNQNVNIKVLGLYLRSFTILKGAKATSKQLENLKKKFKDLKNFDISN